MNSLPKSAPASPDEAMVLLHKELNERYILLLTSLVSYDVKDHGADKQHIFVTLEVRLTDLLGDEPYITRWVGEAIDAPERCLRRAKDRALYEFASSIYMCQIEEVSEQAPVAPPEPVVSAIRRRPQGRVSEAPAAPAPTRAPQQLKLLTSSPTPLDPPAPIKPKLVAAPPVVEQVAVVEKPARRAEPPSDEWKAANALWRALVNEVVSAEVMDALESSVEGAHGVSSWRDVTPEQILASCAELRRRTAIPSDVRCISDREEYILSLLKRVPEGNSFKRVERELARLVEGVTDAATHERFIALYLSKMSAAQLDEVSGRALIALIRKLRKLTAEPRRAFILDALGGADHEAA
jgi:hypothetical protein